MSTYSVKVLAACTLLRCGRGGKRANFLSDIYGGTPGTGDSHHAAGDTDGRSVGWGMANPPRGPRAVPQIERYSGCGCGNPADVESTSLSDLPSPCGRISCGWI